MVKTFSVICPYTICYVSLLFLVPAGSPQNVSAVVHTSTTVYVTFEMMPLISQNGIIITYEVLLEPGIVVNSSDLFVTIDTLNEDTIYNISVRAFTIIGPGPPSSPIVTVRTLEDSTQRDLFKNKLHIYIFVRFLLFSMSSQFLAQCLNHLKSIVMLLPLTQPLLSGSLPWTPMERSPTILSALWPFHWPQDPVQTQGL